METNATRTATKPNGDQIVATLQNVGMKLRDHSYDTWMKTRDYVRSNPGKSMIALAVVGLALTKFLRSRH
jgi:hypothetical protein